MTKLFLFLNVERASTRSLSVRNLVLACFEVSGGVVTHRENIIEREFQTDAKKLSSKKASSCPNNSC